MSGEEVVVVTGATSGIGLATAIGVASRGCRVVVHGRSTERCEAAAATVRSAVRGALVETISGDLASLDAVRLLAGELLARHPAVDVLVNNAGVFTSRRQESVDGLEMQFAVNHVAHFLLTLLLLPALRASGGGRVVTVSSGSHRMGRIHWRDLQLSRFYSGLAAYGQSKLANVLFAYELERRLAGDRVSSYVLEPGLVDTAMGEKGTGPLVRLVWSRRRRHGVSPEEGAATSVFLATDPSVAGRGGAYWAACSECESSPASRREGDAVRLWEVTRELAGISGAVASRHG